MSYVYVLYLHDLRLVCLRVLTQDEIVPVHINRSGQAVSLLHAPGFTVCLCEQMVK